MAGTRETSIRSYNFYVETTVQGTGAWTDPLNHYELIDVDDGTPFLSQTLVFSNDGATDLEFRFTPDPGGGAQHGTVKSGETLQMDFKRIRQIFFQGVVGLAFRFWAW